MDREILFRAKRKDNREWIEGGYAEHDGKVFIVTWMRYIPDTRDWDAVEYYENNPHYDSVLIEVDPETICQYTGLNDKNGKIIWEEDIVRVDKNWNGRVIWKQEDTAFCVFPDDDINHETYCVGYYANECSIEVVGNFFDNPELRSNIF